METKRKIEKDLFQSDNAAGKRYRYAKSQIAVISPTPSLKRQITDDVTDHEKACELSENFSSVFVKHNKLFDFEDDCDAELNRHVAYLIL